MRLFVQLALTAIIPTICVSTLAADDDAAKARKLIDRAIEATGGKMAIEKNRNTIIEDEGTYFGMGEGVAYKGRYVFAFGPPYKSRMEIVGVFTAVYNGEKAWMSFNGNTVELTGEALEINRKGANVARAMSLIPFLSDNDEYKLSLAADETIEGVDCSGIVIDHEDMPSLTIHFNKETGLIRRTSHKSKDPAQGPTEFVENTVYQVYGEFDGVKTPTKMMMYRDGKKYVESNPKQVSYPASLEATEFEKP